MTDRTTTEKIQDYYGNVLQSSADLKTSACCPLDAMPEYLKPLLSKLHTDVQQKFYGCGSPIPLAIEGKTVLDLGCGTGRDVYLLAQLVGENGNVIGVDMTDEQLAVATSLIDYHQDAFGFSKSNTEFHQAFIEDLSFLEDNSVDIVVSNCVLNLSSSKKSVLAEVFRVLKPGGELYFSDIYADRRIPTALKEDPVLLGECLSGALYMEDFRRMLGEVGCNDYRIMSQGTVELHDPAIIAKIGMVNFSSMTIRAFKIDLEDRCENYGHVATYLGGIAQAPHVFSLDAQHTFERGLPLPVCGNTAKMLTDSRFAPYFTVAGDFSTHFGLFDCNSPQDNQASQAPCC